MHIAHYTLTMSDMNIPGPNFLPTMLRPSPFPGFFVNSTSKESVMLEVSADTLSFSLGTHDSSRNTIMVTCLNNRKTC